jgi:hypothetical protein
MIIIEDIIKQRVSLMQPVDLLNGISEKPTYFWGDKNELNRFLITTRSKGYPLIWQTPSNKTIRVNEVEQRSEFIIAINYIKEDNSLFNDDRLELSFKRVLYPLVDDFLNQLNRSPNATVNVNEYELFDYPNYSVTSRENKVVDLWDAVTLKVDVTYMNNC